MTTVPSNSFPSRSMFTPRYSLTRVSDSGIDLQQFSSVIPQFDGCTSQPLQLVPQPSSSTSEQNVTYQCDNCQEVFESTNQLEKHIEENEFVCEECKLCFLSEYDYDLHEHEIHCQSYHTYNLVSPRTKQKAIQRLLAEN